MRTIVIAPTVAEGRKRFPSAVAILTPKARTGARGKAAERVVALRGIQGYPALPALRQTAAWALVTAEVQR